VSGGKGGGISNEKKTVPPSIKSAIKRLREIANSRATKDVYPYPYEIEAELLRAYRLGWRAKQRADQQSGTVYDSARVR